jgi:hypothetical protein
MTQRADGKHSPSGDPSVKGGPALVPKVLRPIERGATPIPKVPPPQQKK